MITQRAEINALINAPQSDLCEAPAPAHIP
jgi:hypothetical protein